MVKEVRAREGAHQYAIPGQQRSLAKGMAASYMNKLDEDKSQERTTQKGERLLESKFKK